MVLILVTQQRSVEQCEREHTLNVNVRAGEKHTHTLLCWHGVAGLPDRQTDFEK